LEIQIKFMAALGLAFSTAAITPAHAAGVSADALAGQAWVEAKPQSGLPGVMMVFLSDGTLLMDSCWETYALRKMEPQRAGLRFVGRRRRENLGQDQGDNADAADAAGKGWA